MKRMGTMNRILWGAVMIGLLGISYWLCRYTFFYMHGMKQWPDLLAMLGLAIMLIAISVGNRIIPIITVIGYMVGFIAAMLFRTEGVDQGGGKTNNEWFIWGAVFVFSILLSFVIILIHNNREFKKKSYD